MTILTCFKSVVDFFSCTSILMTGLLCHRSLYWSSANKEMLIAKGNGEPWYRVIESSPNVGMCPVFWFATKESISFLKWRENLGPNRRSDLLIITCWSEPQRAKVVSVENWSEKIGFYPSLVRFNFWQHFERLLLCFNQGLFWWHFMHSVIDAFHSLLQRTSIDFGTRGKGQENCVLDGI